MKHGDHNPAGHVADDSGGAVDHPKRRGKEREWERAEWVKAQAEKDGRSLDLEEAEDGSPRLFLKLDPWQEETDERKRRR